MILQSSPLPLCVRLIEETLLLVSTPSPPKNIRAFRMEFALKVLLILQQQERVIVSSPLSLVIHISLLLIKEAAIFGTLTITLSITK